MKLALEPASVLAPALPAQPLESQAAAYNRWGAVGGSGVAYPDLDRHAPSERYPVTAPSDADDTRRAYFASTPHVYRGFGGFTALSRRLISAADSSMSRRRRGRS